VTTIPSPGRFTALPDGQTPTATIVTSSSTDSASRLSMAPRRAQGCPGPHPHRSSMMTKTSAPLQETGIADAIDDDDPAHPHAPIVGKIRLATTASASPQTTTAGRRPR
jgi:hypothetical protein